MPTWCFWSQWASYSVSSAFRLISYSGIESEILSNIALLFLFIGFNVYRVVKLTSPNLNYVIVFGAIILLLGNLFLPFPIRNIQLVAIFCTVSNTSYKSVTNQLVLYNNYLLISDSKNIAEHWI